MKIALANFVQSVARRAGYQIRRVDPGVSYGDPLAEIKRLAGPGVGHIVEVGAADGRDTVAFANAYPNARITAFEPLPENFAKLMNAVAEHSNIEPVNAALSDKSGSMPFYVTKLADASSLYRPQLTQSTFDKYVELSDEVTVDVMTLDEYAKRSGFGPIGILKMDVQGSELAVLKGASTLIEEGLVNLIYAEINFMDIYKHAPLYHEVAKFLYRRNFYVHNFYGIVHNQEGRVAWANAIFLQQNKDKGQNA